MSETHVVDACRTTYATLAHIDSSRAILMQSDVRSINRGSQQSKVYVFSLVMSRNDRAVSERVHSI